MFEHALGHVFFCSVLKIRVHWWYFFIEGVVYLCQQDKNHLVGALPTSFGARQQTMHPILSFE
jgi:hypothetical protein